MHCNRLSTDHCIGNLHNVRRNIQRNFTCPDRDCCGSLSGNGHRRSERRLCIELPCRERDHYDDLHDCEYFHQYNCNDDLVNFDNNIHLHFVFDYNSADYWVLNVDLHVRNTNYDFRSDYSVYCHHDALYFHVVVHNDCNDSNHLYEHYRANRSTGDSRGRVL